MKSKRNGKGENKKAEIVKDAEGITSVPAIPETKNVQVISKDMTKDQIIASSLGLQPIDLTEDQEINFDNTCLSLANEEVQVIKKGNIIDANLKKVYAEVFRLLRRQKELDIDNNVKGYEIVDDDQKRKSNIGKLKSLRETQIKGVFHADSDYNLHGEVGSVVFGNRLCYNSEGYDYVKIILNKKRFFHRDGTYEDMFLTSEFLPYTLDRPPELMQFPDDLKSVLLNVCFTMKLLSQEWMSREIAGVVKQNRFTFLIYAIMGFAVGLLVGGIFI